MNDDEIFELAERARLDSQLEQGEDGMSDTEDAYSIFENPVNMKTGRSQTVWLRNGEVHVCYGPGCRFAELDREKQWVCTLSGTVVGVEHSASCDPCWTGRSSGSANPDDLGGGPSGGYIRKRDMYSASVEAWRLAASFEGCSTAASVVPPKAPKATAPKRGALCVNETAEKSAPTKRARNSKHVFTRDSIERLTSEATSVLNKLFIVDRASSAIEQLDPRLQNVEFVRTVSLRKYAKACVEEARQPTMSDIHDVCLASNEFVRNQRELASKSSTPIGRKACFSGQVRNVISKLIVSLWRVSSMTPFFTITKKSNDSFRPFCAGVLYSLKRGVYLESGTCVVPELPSLAEHLPALRSTSSSQAKQLQSSSHRGICSFHRSISSISELPADEAEEVWKLVSDSAKLAATLRELVHQTDR